jgi:cytochrome c5
MTLSRESKESLFWFVMIVLLVGFAALTSASEFTESCGKTQISLKQHRELDPTAKAVKILFQAKCVACHQPTHASGPFIDVLDAKELHDKNITTGDPEKSRLYASLNRASNWMPLGSATPLPLDEKNVILDWLKAGTPSLDEGQLPPPQGTYPEVAYSEVTECVFNDLNHAGLSGAPISVADRKFQFYITLGELPNAEVIERAQYGVSKLINSLSLQQTITKARRVDKFGLVYAIDVRDYGLKRADFDDLIQRGKYPYALVRFDDDNIESFENEIAKLTNTNRNETIAFVNAGWLLFTLSQPPFYYDFLRLPPKIADLERILNVNKAQQVKDQDANRAGVRHSGVTLANRLVDRYDLEFKFGPKGDYWLTWDTKGEDGKRNLFDFVFSPFDFLLAGKVSDRAFEFDANEVIFTLPNGLSGYYLADGRGNRIDAADTAIAFDKSNNAQHLGKVPGEIINGVSCMGCHAGGMNFFTDEFRDFTLAAGGFSNEEADLLDDLTFKSNTQLKAALLKYTDAFSVSQTSVGIDKVKLTAQADEPVYQSARYYADYVDACALGRYLNLSCADTKLKLSRADALARKLGYGSGGSGAASRRNIEVNFEEIAREFNVGEQIIFKKKVNPPVKPPVKPEPPVKPPVKPEPPIACDGYPIKNASAYGVRLGIYNLETKEDLLHGVLVMDIGDSFTYKQTLPEIGVQLGNLFYKLIRCQKYIIKDKDGHQEFFTITE